MKKFRSVVPVLLVSALLSVGAFAVASCGSYPFPTNRDAVCATPGGAATGTGIKCAAGVSPSTSGSLPCDIFENACQPCVSAHSTVRLLRSAYTGPLYQVQRLDETTKDIMAVDGYADASGQDSFCSGSVCTVKIIYDQSTQKNDLTIAIPGGYKKTYGNPAKAKDLPITINGHSVYGLKFKTGMGYRVQYGKGIATGDDPETMYMVSSQQDLVNGCCFDYGNAETDAHDDGNGTMEAVYVGEGVVWGRGSGNEHGPWVMADLENGLYPGWENHQDKGISTNTPLLYDFITAVVVGDTKEKNCGAGRFALYGGDATSGDLKTMYDGMRPDTNGYVPMQKQGSIILSVGGDNSDGDGGRFYEGVMVNGASTKATIDALQANIVAAGYGK
jgi:non-reducing end alpha-L-arabinofuranosidase